MNYNCRVSPKTTCRIFKIISWTLFPQCIISVAWRSTWHYLSWYMYFHTWIWIRKCQITNACFLKKNVPQNLLTGFSFKSPIFMDTVKKWSVFNQKGVNFYGIVIFVAGEQSSKSAKIETQKISHYPAGLSFKTWMKLSAEAV